MLLPKRNILILLAACAMTCSAQNRPTGACAFQDFDAKPERVAMIAEVATKGPALTWLGCESPKGCISLPVQTGSPVLIYSVQDSWTCGYYEDRRGAGPVWFRSTDLHPIHYELNPPLTAWAGLWAGGENRVRIDLANGGSGLHLKGNATWHGIAEVEHYGNIDGGASPKGNQLHFAPDVPDGCVVDLTLLGKFILASDNNGCGGMNVRFEGFWRRTVPR